VPRGGRCEAPNKKERLPSTTFTIGLRGFQAGGRAVRGYGGAPPAVKAVAR